MNEMHKHDACTFHTSSQTEKITIASGIDGGIPRSLIHVTSTYYTIAMLRTCRKSLQPKLRQYEKYARKQ
jgi:prenyltransferase beta subunit